MGPPISQLSHCCLAAIRLSLRALTNVSRRPLTDVKKLSGSPNAASQPPFAEKFAFRSLRGGIFGIRDLRAKYERHLFLFLTLAALNSSTDKKL